MKEQTLDDNKSDRRSTHTYIYRSLPTHKTGNYLACYLALQEAKKRGTQEAILTDDRGNWLETTTGNLWGWCNDRWWTPPVEAGILPGLMRSQLIDWLEQNHRPAIEEPWTPEIVGGFEAIGYSNSVVGIIPIREILSTTGTLTYSASHPGFGQLRNLFQ
ncbi:MAG: aminotransferase class IV [Oscillatoria sp. SIO1A7]|nr:aminotransferase class IV [Oscillatoria sp. SIO1A7]